MGISVRLAEGGDLEFVGQDRYLDSDILKRKVDHGEVFLAEMDGVPAGYLRLEFLWSAQPYIALVRVIEAHRGRGVGKAMLAYVEEVLRSSGRSSLLSSSQADEPEPQAWHRHMGFVECGIINGLNEGVGEIFFAKQL